MSSRFRSNSEADASELLGNLEEIFPRYYVHGNVFWHGDHILEDTNGLMIPKIQQILTN